MPDNLEGSLDRDRFSSGLLRLYLVYRFLLSLSLLFVYVSGIAPELVGAFAPGLFLSSVVIYLSIGAVTLGFYQLQRYRLNNLQLMITLLVDVAIQTLLMYASGGLGSGIGYLLIVTVAAGAIFFTGQLAVLIPAVSSICILAESVLSEMFLGRTTDTILPAGVLGLILFVTSLVFSRLSDALMVAQRIARTESDLSAELRELNETIINRMRTGIIVVDTDTRIMQLNNAARELLGYTASGKPLNIGDSIVGETRLMERLNEWQERPTVKAEPFVASNGNTELQVNFAALDHQGHETTIVFLEDFRAAAQRAQQLKLASLGRLTGSIAHEIRNPLGAISYASELLSERQGDDREIGRLTEIVNTHVKRVNHIVESVMQVSRQEYPSPQMIAIGPWLREFIDSYLQGKREKPEIVLQFIDAEVNRVIFDPVQLQQVVINLVDNALRYSEQATGRGWAGIAVSHLHNESLVNLDVADRGPGVPEEHRNKLFEPFFTTSKGGSGLGLYIASELCAINYATLKYHPPSAGENGYFRITFIQPDKRMNRD